MELPEGPREALIIVLTCWTIGFGILALGLLINILKSQKMKNKKPLHINQVLKLPINRVGKNGDAILMHNNFIIFLKTKKKFPICLNEFLEIRITKIMPSFALAVLTKEVPSKP